MKFFFMQFSPVSANFSSICLNIFLDTLCTDVLSVSSDYIVINQLVTLT